MQLQLVIPLDFEPVPEPAGIRPESPDDPVVVFIASRNTRSAYMRVLWRLTRAEAKTMCSDERTGGQSFMLCWTARPGVEGEDWRWIEDKGSFDTVLDEYRITPERRSTRKAACAA